MKTQFVRHAKSSRALVWIPILLFLGAAAGGIWMMRSRAEPAEMLNFGDFQKELDSGTFKHITVTERNNFFELTAVIDHPPAPPRRVMTHMPLSALDKEGWTRLTERTLKGGATLDFQPSTRFPF